MAATYVQLPPDSTGKKVQAWNNTVGSDDVYTQASVATHTDGTALTTANGLIIGGNVASGATDAGNPVKIGGRYNSTLPTLSNGQRGDLQLGTRGSLAVTLFAQDSTSTCLLYTSPSPRDGLLSRMPSSA